MFTFFELKEKLAVQGTVSLAGPKVGPFQICSPKGTPGTGAKYPSPLQHCAYRQGCGASKPGSGRGGPHDRQSSHNDLPPSCSSPHRSTEKHPARSGVERTRWSARWGWFADPGHREPDREDRWYSLGNLKTGAKTIGQV